MIIQPVLSVRDVATSLDFYTKHLGFQHEGDPLPGPDGKPVFAGVMYGPTMLMLNGNPDDTLSVDTPRGKGIELHVSLPDDADIDALYARLKNAGVPVVGEMREEFWGEKRFSITDPDGYRLSIAKTVRAVTFDEMADHTRQE